MVLKFDPLSKHVRMRRFQLVKKVHLAGCYPRTLSDVVDQGFSTILALGFGSQRLLSHQDQP